MRASGSLAQLAGIKQHEENDAGRRY